MTARDTFPPGAVATPRMQRRLWMLAALAAFVVFVVAIAFVAAFRNTDAGDPPVNLVRIDTDKLQEGDAQAQRVDSPGRTGVVRPVELFIVRVDGRVHAFSARSTHLGCLVVRRGDGFQDPCGGSTFALDGRCLSGPCPRDLDEFAVVDRGGAVYADLRQVQRGERRHA